MTTFSDALRLGSPLPTVTMSRALDCIVSELQRKLGFVACGEQNDALIARCKQGDRAAFRELFHKHRMDVARLAFRMLGPRTELEDIVQEVFLQVYRSLPEFRGESKFSTWLHRLTVNVVLMHRRAARSRPCFSDEVSPEPESMLPHPEEDVIRRERVRAFYAVLDRLSEKKRVVFILHEIEGMAPSEIAKVVGAPILTVRTRLFYARRDMIQYLKEDICLAAFADTMLRPGSADLASSELPESTS